MHGYYDFESDIENIGSIEAMEAYQFAMDNSYYDIEKYQKIACWTPCYAYHFASDVPGADIEYCQKRACRSPQWAYCFALGFPEADIEYCYNLSEWYKKILKNGFFIRYDF